MAKNINNIKVKVYKDAGGMIFPTGKMTSIPCDHQKISQTVEGLSVQATVTPCLTTIPEGQEIVSGDTALPNLASVYKLKVKGSFIFVDSDDYDANIGNCNGCCAPVSCGIPTNIVASSITSTGAHIDFLAPAATPGTGFEYVVNTSSSAPTGSGTYSATGAVVLTGLTTATAYHFWVRTRCSASSASTWTSITFTTA